MRIRLRHLWDSLTTSYWFVPALMVAGAVALAFTMLWIDRSYIKTPGASAWLYAGGPDGALAVLSTIAAAVITVAGVVFSITISTLSQASSQFGPRILRNFMRDTGNQVVLGTFVATFTFCLLVLRTIYGDGDDRDASVPHASVTVSVLLAAACVAVLIYFIHHVSVSLQAPIVVATVRAELDAVISRLPEGHEGAAVPAASTSIAALLPPDFDAAARPIRADVEGYVQAVDYDELLAIARRHDLILRLANRPGDPIIRGNTLLHAYPPDRCPDSLIKPLNATFLCGRHATPEQDPEHAIDQMVEVAVRALSPGVNDPFTAINCVDALAASLCLAARRGLPGPLRHDPDGNLRLVTPVTTFAGLTDAAFNQIRQYSRDSVAVTARLLDAITACAQQMTTPDQRAALLRHARMIHRQAERSFQEPDDLHDLRTRYESASRALGADRAAPDTLTTPR